jgi:hypothetical protein
MSHGCTRINADEEKTELMRDVSLIGGLNEMIIGGRLRAPNRFAVCSLLNGEIAQPSI